MTMMQKLNLRSFLGQDTQQSFYLLIDDIDKVSVKGAIEWIFDCNFSEQHSDILNLIVCSPGGDLNAAFALIDTMAGSSIPIRTIGLGQICSSGLLIFISGKKGERILTPNTSILSHQYTWGSFGKSHELLASAKEFDLTSQRLIEHYKRHTGLTEKAIKETLLPPHDVWLSAKEAQKLGICDIVKDLK